MKGHPAIPHPIVTEPGTRFNKVRFGQNMKIPEAATLCPALRLRLLKDGLGKILGAARPADIAAPGTDALLYAGGAGRARAHKKQGCIKLWFSPSPPSDGGEGWGEEARFI